MDRVFIKRFPSNGELPKENDKDYCSNVGMVYFRKGNFYFRDEQLITFTNKVEWFLEEIELPSGEEIGEKAHSEAWDRDMGLSENNSYETGYWEGANFILNHIKGGEK